MSIDAFRTQMNIVALLENRMSIVCRLKLSAVGENGGAGLSAEDDDNFIDYEAQPALVGTRCRICLI